MNLCGYLAVQLMRIYLLSRMSRFGKRILLDKLLIPMDLPKDQQDQLDQVTGFKCDTLVLNTTNRKCIRETALTSLKG